MRRYWPVLILIVVAVSAFLLTTAVSEKSALLTYVPGEPLVVVSVHNLTALANQVRGLPAAKQYLSGKALTAYQESKLALKLADRAERLSKLAGMDLSLDTLLDNSGSETVLALYDIGDLLFLVLTRMAPDEQAKLGFVQRKTDFTERIYEGRRYLANAADGMSFVFYQEGDLLFVGNSVELIENALQAQKAPDAAARLVSSEKYKRLIAMQPKIPEMAALVYVDLQRLKDDRYFKNYWAWRNQADLTGYEAALTGFDCDGKTMHETRALSGPPGAAPAAQLEYQGPGLAAYASGGQNAGKRLAAHFEWDFKGENFDGLVRSRLIVAQPATDFVTGLVTMRLGAVMDAPELKPETVMQSVADGLRAAHPALPKSIAVKNINGVLALETWPGYAGAYAAKSGNLLFLANDPQLLAELKTGAREKPAGLLSYARADGKTARLLSEFLNQAESLNAARGDGAEFATGTLPEILKAAGSFARLTASTVPAAGGLLQEARWE